MDVVEQAVELHQRFLPAFAVAREVRDRTVEVLDGLLHHSGARHSVPSWRTWASGASYPEGRQSRYHRPLKVALAGYEAQMTITEFEGAPTGGWPRTSVGGKVHGPDQLRFGSMADFYLQVYGHVAPRVHRVGRLGASVVRAFQPAGDWSDAALPDLVISTLPHGPTVVSSIDLGSGRFVGPHRAGGTIVVAPNTATSIQIDGNHELLGIGIPYRSLLEFVGPEAGLPGDGDFGPLHSGLIHNAELSTLLWRLGSAERTEGILHADGLLLQLAGILTTLASAPRPTCRGGLATWQVRRVREHLEAHLDQDVSLAALAEIAGLSPFHFSRMFKQATGLPPSAFLRCLRCERAKALLETTSMTVLDVALDVGYESGQALSRVFQREAGCSPAAWRRERRRR